MLRPAAKRYNSSQVLEHEWLKILDGKIPSAPMPPLVIESLNKFKNYQKAQKAVLTYIATQLSEQEIIPLRMHFLNLDKNGDGILSTDEISNILKKATVETNLQEIVQALDTNDSGFIDYNGILLII